MKGVAAGAAVFFGLLALYQGAGAIIIGAFQQGGGAAGTRFLVFALVAGALAGIAR